MTPFPNFADCAPSTGLPVLVPGSGGVELVESYLRGVQDSPSNLQSNFSHNSYTPTYYT